VLGVGVKILINYQKDFFAGDALMDYTDIFVTGAIQDIQVAIQHIFQQNGFTIEWKDQQAGKAKRGSKGMNVALGAFAPYYEIGFQIYQASDGSIGVRLLKSSGGWTGGAIGAHRVGRQYEEIVDLISNYFYQQGVYRGRNPP